MDELKVFTGNAHPELAKAVAKYLKIPLGECQVSTFSNENIFVRIQENVRQRDTFVIQPICSPVNNNLVELLIMLDALKRASAGRITAVVPYYGYGRTDKKDQPRAPITARLVADLLTVAGANRLLTVDLHSGQIQGFFNIPVDELTPLKLFVKYFKEKKLKNLVVVAPDIGAAKRARDLAKGLGASVAIVEKKRIGNTDQIDKEEPMNVVGEVEGKVALTVDDEIATGGSMLNAVEELKNRGVKAENIYACCTHPIFSGPAVEDLAAADINEVVATDTVPVPGAKKLDKIIVLPIAPLLGEAIHRIHTGQSVSAMFE